MRAQSLGSRVDDSEFSVYGLPRLGFRVWGFKVEGLGFRVEGLGFRAQDLGFMACGRDDFSSYTKVLGIGVTSPRQRRSMRASSTWPRKTAIRETPQQKGD